MKNYLFAILFALLCVAYTSKTQLLPQARHIKTLPNLRKTTKLQVFRARNRTKNRYLGFY